MSHASTHPRIHPPTWAPGAAPAHQRIHARTHTPTHTRTHHTSDVAVHACCRFPWGSRAEHWQVAFLRGLCGQGGACVCVCVSQHCPATLSARSFQPDRSGPAACTACCVSCPVLSSPWRGSATAAFPAAVRAAMPRCHTLLSARDRLATASRCHQVGSMSAACLNSSALNAPRHRPATVPCQH